MNLIVYNFYLNTAVKIRQRCHLPFTLFLKNKYTVEFSRGCITRDSTTDQRFLSNVPQEVLKHAIPDY